MAWWGLYTAVCGTRGMKPVSQNFAPLSDSIGYRQRSWRWNTVLHLMIIYRGVIPEKGWRFYPWRLKNPLPQSRGNPWNHMIICMATLLFRHMILGIFCFRRLSLFGVRAGFRNYYGNSQVRYYYENIVVLDASKTGHLIWSNVVHKSQFIIDNDNYLSYNVILTGRNSFFYLMVEETYAAYQRIKQFQRCTAYRIPPLKPWPGLWIYAAIMPNKWVLTRE